MTHRRVSRFSPPLWALALGLLPLLWFGSARAQHMYLDVNGDGINDSNDVLTSYTTSVDVWLRTDRNRDESPVVCSSSSSPLTIHSYEIILRASGGITWGAWTDRMNFPISLSYQNSTDFYVLRAALFNDPPGLYRLGTLAISGIGPTTTLSIVAGSTVQPTGYTSFGSVCEGIDFDNTLKLGQDWNDVSGALHGCVDPPSWNNFPSLAVPATATGVEGFAVAISATATDPDAGQWLTISASDAPGSLTLSGASGIAPVTARLSGNLRAGEQGSYAIRWFVHDGVCAADTATTLLTVTGPDRLPVVSAPAAVDGVENVPIEFTATASDPDGDPIEAITASFLPTGATFVPDASKTWGTFAWKPDFSQAGTYRVEISAVSACRAVTVSGETRTTCLQGGMTTTIVVAEGDQPPWAGAPSSVSGEEDAPLLIRVESGDPDGGEIASFTAAPLPAGAEFKVTGDLTLGVFDWTPARGQAGEYVVTFTASNGLSGSAVTRIAVRAGPDRPPGVTSPAAVAGVAGSPVSFTASAADPDGDPIESFTAAPLPAGATFTVDASRSTGAFEWTPDLTQAGAYSVLLSAESACRPTGVSGEVLCAEGSATTTIVIANAEENLAANAFVTHANRVIRLGSGRVSWCVQVEPVNGSYENSAVVPASLSLSYGGMRIAAISEKTLHADDQNGNGVQELTVCFAKEDLRTLFAGLSRGTSVVDVAIEGEVLAGGRFHADLAVSVAVTGPRLAATVAPNPMNPEAVLTFTTTRPGWARVSLFDLQGRLARRLVDEGSLEAGFHDVRLDGTREDGTRMPSGVYFYRVESEEGTALGRVVIAK